MKHFLWTVKPADPRRKIATTHSGFLGLELKRMERHEGPDAALAAMAAAMSHPNDPPDDKLDVFAQCSSILDWASRSADPKGAPPDGQCAPPRFLPDLGDSLHPKAVFARQFMIRALEGPEQCAMGAAEQLAGQESMCARWRDGAAPEPFPIERAFPLWARLSPAWMLCEPLFCKPLLAALEREPEKRGEQLRLALAGQPWLSDALEHWKRTRGAYHKDFVKEFFETNAKPGQTPPRTAQSLIPRTGSDTVGQSLAAQLRLWTRLGFEHRLLLPDHDPHWLRQAAHALGGVEMVHSGATSAFVSEAERALMSWIMPESPTRPTPRPRRI